MVQDNYWKRRSSLLSRRASRRKFLAGAGIGFGGALTLVACGGSDGDNGGSATPTEGSDPKPSVKRGGVLKVNLAAEVSTFDPPYGSSGFDLNYLNGVYDTLFAWDSKGAIDPNRSVAETSEWENDTTLRVRIRHGIRFHDGTTLDAEAVAYSFERSLTPPSWATAPSVFRRDLGTLVGTEVLGPNELRLKLSGPYGLLPSNLGGRMGMIVSPTAAEAAGRDFGRAPVGSGPFRLANWTSGAQITLERNEEYWYRDEAGEPLPYLDGVDIALIPDRKVQLLNLEGGQVHFTEVDPVDARAKQGSDGFNLQQFVGSGFNGILFNTSKAPFDNPDVRRAISHVIDRESISGAWGFGILPPAKGPITPAYGNYYDPDFEAPKLDLTAARELLRKAGVPDGLEIPGLSFNSPADVQRVEILQAQLGEVGLDLRAEFMDVPTGAAAWQRGEAESLIAGSTFFPAEPHPWFFGLYHSTGGSNPGGMRDPEIDSWLEAITREPDSAQRRDLYRRVQTRVVEDAHHAFETYRVALFAASDDVASPESILTASGNLDFRNASLA